MKSRDGVALRERVRERSRYLVVTVPYTSAARALYGRPSRLQWLHSAEAEKPRLGDPGCSAPGACRDRDGRQASVTLRILLRRRRT